MKERMEKEERKEGEKRERERERGEREREREREREKLVKSGFRLVLLNRTGINAYEAGIINTAANTVYGNKILIQQKN